MFEHIYKYSFTILVFTIWIIGCRNSDNNSGPRYSDNPLYSKVPVYHFAIHPLHNPAKLIEEYQPLIDYLNDNIKEVRFNIQSSRDYNTFEQKYKSKLPEFILPNPWQTIQAIKCDYHVIATAGSNEDFKGLFVIRTDNKITKPDELKGKSISYPAETALAACIMPQYFLHINGINIDKDIENKYVGSQESSIMNVYYGLTEVGATWTNPWRAFCKKNPEKAKGLRVIWETDFLINNSVMVRNDIPEEISQKVAQLLIKLNTSQEGNLILTGIETEKFTQANNEEYNIVSEYVNRYEKEIHKISKTNDY